MIKIGIDLHGVIDRYPKKFIKLCNQIMKDTDNEVHVLSGPEADKIIRELVRICEEYNEKSIFWTHIFSIVDYIKREGIDYKTNERGHLWCEKELWDSAKGNYAKKHKLDLVIDNSPEYSSYCEDGTFLLF